MVRKVCRLIVALSILFGYVGVHAEQAERLVDLLSNNDSLSGTFKQSLLDERGDTMQVNQGLFFFKNPGYLRWETIDPFPQLLISDRKQVWIYDPDLEQVTVRDVQVSQDNLFLLLFSGDIQGIHKYYDISLNSDAIFVLSPKAERSDFSEVRIQFSDNFIESIVVKDTLSQTSLFEFSRVVVDENLSQTLFVFTPPDNVEVIHDVAPDHIPSSE